MKNNRSICRTLRRCFSAQPVPKSIGPDDIAILRRAVKVSGAPSSVSTIPDKGIPSPSNGAFIRQVGCTRRIFLLRPHLNSGELEGLAYRIMALTKNDSLNSILISTDESEERTAMPSSLLNRESPKSRNDNLLLDFDDIRFSSDSEKTQLVSSGYDALTVYKSGAYRNFDDMMEFLNHLSQLASSVRGDKAKTKIPVITIPNGAILDGGYAFCTGSYVLATRDSCFRILNPSRGLSLDPVGLSYILPRLGLEFRQPAMNFTGCGMLLGLTGYEADAMDMVETGLATHYFESQKAIGLLEMTLSELPPWNQQGLLKDPIRYYSEPEPTHDHNATFRNVAVAETIHSLTAFGANANADLWTLSEDDHSLIEDDPSLETDPMAWHGERNSLLVNIAATFDSIFKNEDTLVGILERFREIASRKSSDPDEMEGIEVAGAIVSRLQEQSPLATSVIHKLLQLGSSNKETMNSCMERERKVQAKLFGGADFENWARHATQTDPSRTPSDGWKHKTIADVSADEVAEIIEI